ncbi:calcium-binding protein [Inquilinus sp. CA228]|uniref:calcium-binding protein n=1 Tax=Inquilinus sp. CA228 TaxID=3455609 RepID=UPI003F8D5CAA
MGHAGVNVLDGGAGDDTLDGDPGIDTLIGGAGNDTFVLEGDADIINDSAGIDTVTSTVSRSLIDYATIENLILEGTAVDGVGNALNNVLTGNGGSNTLNGGGGNDFVDGGAGADTLRGGAGDDTYIVDDAGDAVDERWPGSAGNDTVQSSVHFSLADSSRVFGSVENLTLVGLAGLNGTGNGVANVLVGNDGSNLLDGAAGNDVLRGGAGADALYGGTGIDTASYYTGSAGVMIDLSTGKGSGGEAQGDILVDIENLSGSQGSDTLAGNASANTLQGWNGSDVLRGGAGADRLEGGVGTDTASYFSGTTGVVVSLASGLGSAGEAQGDILTGIENLSGSQGSDSLYGNAGANVLQGWNGNDALFGRAGKDTLTGGAGSDRFSFTTRGDSVVGANADRITDFSHAQGDRIDLAGIDARTTVAGDQAFSFIGAGLFTGVAGQLRFAFTIPGVTAIAGDVNGDRVSDFHITLTGTIHLVAADFVL